jgi:hypothetical protein
MDFEEMKVIWDSQNERPLYAFDLDALHAAVRRQARKISCTVRFLDLSMVGMTLALAVFLAVAPLLHGTDRYRLLGAGLFLFSSIYLFVGARRRRRHEQQFAATLLGDLDKAIAQQDYHIGLSVRFAVWFLLPAAVVSLSGVLAEQQKSRWSWLLSLGGLALCYALTRYERRCVLRPKKRELESLRAKLTSAE